MNFSAFSRLPVLISVAGAASLFGCASDSTPPPEVGQGAENGQARDVEALEGQGGEPLAEQAELDLSSVDPEQLQAPVFGAEQAPRVLIVGDSISAGPGCYKGQLLRQLTDAGYSQFEFVGSYTDDCGGGVMHGAVSCSTASQYTQDSFQLPNCFEGQTFSGLAPLMQEHTPDLLMLQLGVNDVWSLRAVDAILADYTELVRQAREQNPDVVLLVAQIHQVRPECSNEAVFERAQQLVQAVPAWAAEETTEASPVFVADLWTNSDPNQSTGDCVHPDADGAARMGGNWFEALSPLLTAD